MVFNSMRNTFYLVRQELYNHSRQILLLGAIILIYFLFSRSLIVWDHVHIKYNSTDISTTLDKTFWQILKFAGCVFISFCFSHSMHDRVNQSNWMMLPVHSLEKLTALILVYSIIYPFGVILLANIFSLISYLFMPERSVFLWSILNNETWIQAAGFAIISSLFLLGAAYYKKAPFLKTLLLIIIFLIALAITIKTRIALTYDIPSRDVKVPFQLFGIPHENYPFTIRGAQADSWEDYIKIFYWKLLAPLCWFTTHLLIRKKEAKNAV
ncbi:MAG: hypothetical protein PQJ59_02545 [Spirochaetales bacterium]|nr:hypothetical protein [Spirochaetales bacterium]